MDRPGAAPALRVIAALLLGALMVGGIGVLRALPAASPAEADLTWLMPVAGGVLATLAAASTLASLVHGLRLRLVPTLLEAAASAALVGGGIALASGADAMDLAVAGSAVLLLAAMATRGLEPVPDAGRALLIAIGGVVAAEAMMIVGLLPPAAAALEPYRTAILGLAAACAAFAGLVSVARGGPATGVLVAVGAIGLLAARDGSLEAFAGMLAFIASQVAALGTRLSQPTKHEAIPEHRLPELADQLNDAVLRFDGGLRLREWNRMAADLLGLDPGSVGARAQDLLGVSLAELQAAEGNAVARTAVGGLEVAVHRSGGGVTAIVRDPGARPEAERLGSELRATIDELLRARRTIDLQREELERASTVDGLTGVASRGAILQRLRIEVAEARRYRHPLAVVLIDIDGFGAINQEHGVAGADAVLREVALRFRLRVREADALGRAGSDGFIAILPHTDEGGAAVFANALRHRLALRPVSIGDAQPTVTVSIGVTTMRPGEDLDVDGLLGRGLEALESASRAGGDRIALDRQHGLARLEDPDDTDVIG